MKQPTQTKQQSRLSPAEILGSLACPLAILLFFINPWLALVPLLLFLLLCLVAPFFPQIGFFLPIISRSITDNKGVALTFDDGPSPDSTPILLALLARYNLQATFFVVGTQAAKYPELITDILAQGHTIGNHSWQHDNLLMLRSSNRLEQDIRRTQEVLSQHDIRPAVFRPPAGITNPRLKKVLLEEGLLTVTFSCRAFDHGNRKIINLANRILSKLKAGDIILLHDLPPADTATESWQRELNTLFAALATSPHTIQPLEKLIGHPAMTYKNSL